MKVTSEFATYKAVGPECPICMIEKEEWIGHAQENSGLEPIHLTCLECFQQTDFTLRVPACPICSMRITSVNGIPILEYLSARATPSQIADQETRWLEAIRVDARTMQNGMIDCDNKPFVLKAVAVNPEALEHASERLGGDPDVVMAAILRDGNAFLHANQPLRADVDFVLQAIKRIMERAVMRAEDRSDPFHDQYMWRARDQCIHLVQNSLVQRDPIVVEILNELFAE